MPWEPLPSAAGDEPHRLGEGLDRLVRSFGMPSADALKTIFSHWTDLVGEAVSANCRPIRLHDGQLTVAAFDPAWSTQLRLLEPVLIERMDDLIGVGSVTKIVVRVRPE